VISVSPDEITATFFPQPFLRMVQAPPKKAVAAGRSHLNQRDRGHDTYDYDRNVAFEPMMGGHSAAADRRLRLHGPRLRQDPAGRRRLCQHSAHDRRARAVSPGMGHHIGRSLRRFRDPPGRYRRIGQHTDGGRSPDSDVHGAPAIWIDQAPGGDSCGRTIRAPGYETDLLYLACLAALVLGGSGPGAIDGVIANILRKKQTGRSRH
jgi:hypothetical protein